MAFKDRIEEIASDKGMNLTEFAKKIDISYRTLQNYTGGVSPPKMQFYERVCEKFGVSADWLLFGFEPKYAHQSATRATSEQTITNTPASELVIIPRYQVEASAGHGSAVTSEDETGYYGFKREWLERRSLKANNLSVISVSGDSMEPDLRDGDLIVIDHATTSLADGNIYAVRFSDGLYVKRIQHLPEDKVHLISSNRNYPPIEITHPTADGVEVVGRVVASMHEW